MPLTRKMRIAMIKVRIMDEDRPMFGKKKKIPLPAFDVTQKVVRTWWGGKKMVPTTKAEQKKMKAQILAVYPEATILDSEMKKRKDIEWIDRVEELDALFSD